MGDVGISSDEENKDLKDDSVFINTQDMADQDGNTLKGKMKEGQRGFITNYLTSLTVDQIIQNTLTGFLVDLIRKKGNLMQFSNIMAYTQDRFETLRKPNGKPYNHTSGNLKRSISCALTSNGVFQKVAPMTKACITPKSRSSATAGTSTKEKEIQRDINKELWQVNEEKANEYFED